VLYAIAVLLVWNLIVFIIYGIDKSNAQAHLRRISEKILLLCAFLMGGLGAFLGMQILRHKTKHTRFIILVPLALILNIAVCVGVWMLFR